MAQDEDEDSESDHEDEDEDDVEIGNTFDQDDNNQNWGRDYLKRVR